MIPKCSVTGCNNNCMSAGHGYYKKLCTRHHRLKYKMPVNSRMPNHLTGEPCSKCGWDKSFCDTHRIIGGKDGGKYTKDNVISLCPNCHRLEHSKN
jgi:hypothetical protein